MSSQDQSFKVMSSQDQLQGHEFLKPVILSRADTELTAVL